MTDQSFETIPCNLCGADSPIVIYPSRRAAGDVVDISAFRSSSEEMLQDRLVRCAVCGFQYVSPRVAAEMALEGYTGAIEETFASQAKGRERTFKRCLNAVQRVWKKPPGRIFDVGTGNGSFLKVAKDAGWEVAGCEPNHWLCKWCGDNYGIQVTPGTIFDCRREAESFDVVTLWDVLEHTPDPMATLRECARLLRPNGVLAVNYPDIGSWIARLMGRRWVFLVSVHYFYFTRKTLKRALQQSGLTLLGFKPHIQSLELDYVLRRAVPYTGKIGEALRTTSRATGLGKLQAAYWIGQTLAIAVKP